MAVPVFQEPSPEVLRISELVRRDDARGRKEMLKLYRQDGIRTAADYLLAARTLESSKDRNDLLMAHDMAVAALALGEGGAKNIVARTEDRLFKSVGLGERFGTLKGENLPLTTQHRQLMTMASGLKMAVRMPVPSVN